MEKLLQDIRYGARSILKAPRFTVAAVLTLALGIGANTVMFSVIRSVLMRSWPFPNPGRLLLVSQRQANGNSNLFSTQDYLDWKQQGGLLAHMGAHVSWQFNISSPGEPAQRISGGMVSYDFLPVLGAHPLLGRLFAPQEDQPGAGQFVMLSYAFWRNRFGADPHIIGKSLQMAELPEAKSCQKRLNKTEYGVNDRRAQGIGERCPHPASSIFRNYPPRLWRNRQRYFST
jgi:putative ABC transport system permease protein